MSVLESYKNLRDNTQILYEEQVNNIDYYMKVIDSLLKKEETTSIRKNIVETVKNLAQQCPDISKDDILKKVKIVYERNIRAFPPELDKM